VFRCQCYKTYLLICRQSPSAERHLSFPPTTGPQPTLPDKRRKTSAWLAQHRGLPFQRLGTRNAFSTSCKTFCRTEPIGSSPPKLVGDSKINLVTKQKGSFLSLVCPAQAMPIPSFRCASNAAQQGRQMVYCTYLQSKISIWVHFVGPLNC
jgi:hypothetical protein